MRAILQRVSEAKVKVAGHSVGEIKQGLLVLVAIGHHDNEKQASKMLDKILKLRIFDDSEGKLNLSIKDIGGELLIVSQFTLFADASQGNRPSYIQAARPEQAKPMYEKFVELARASGLKVATGQFQTPMEIQLVNDGPVTISLEI